MQLNAAAKGWLWFVFIVNALVCLSAIGTAVTLSPKIGIFTAAAEVLILIGVGLLLFKQKKVGFYIICAVVVVNLVVNIVLGVGIIRSVISAVIMPLITFLCLKSQWDELG